MKEENPTVRAIDAATGEEITFSPEGENVTVGLWGLGWLSGHLVERKLGPQNPNELPFRQVWEEYYPKIVRDGDCYDYECPHVHIKDEKRIIPRVLEAINEGGHNSTGICLDCLINWLIETGEVAPAAKAPTSAQS